MALSDGDRIGVADLHLPSAARAPRPATPPPRPVPAPRPRQHRPAQFNPFDTASSSRRNSSSRWNDDAIQQALRKTATTRPHRGRARHHLPRAALQTEAGASIEALLPAAGGLGWGNDPFADDARRFPDSQAQCDPPTWRHATRPETQCGENTSARNDARRRTPLVVDPPASRRGWTPVPPPISDRSILSSISPPPLRS